MGWERAPRPPIRTPRPASQGDDHQGLFAEDNAVACMLDMLMAGTETTSSTLQWAALLMAKHPDIQGEAQHSLAGHRCEGTAPTDMVPTSGTDRVQEELDRVLGAGRLPQPEDQQQLPYTSAVLHEVQRYITLLPHVPRCTVTDTQLGGYLLPKVDPQASLPPLGTSRTQTGAGT